MKEKKTIVLTVIGVLTFIVVVVGATYAYYQVQGGITSTSGASVDAYTTDSFILKSGDDINIEVNQTNFASGNGDISGSTYASATLTANNKTNAATEYYYLYLNINKNELVYTTEDKKTELLLTVTDNDGNAITSINGLTYDSSLGGFDITEASGTIAILDNREITVEESNTTHQTVDYWNITITMINLDTDQTDNAGKSVEATIKITKDKEPTLADLCDGLTFANCISTVAYTTDGVNGLYYHDGTGTYGEYEAGDYSYRYSGADPDNYVCFGTDEDTCPTDNLYRIIGVFDGRVKLIKYDYATSDVLGTDGAYYGTGTPNSSYYKGSLSTIYRYYWNNSTSTNTWSESNLNTVNLNSNYWASLGSTWQSYIDDTTWIVGGNTYSNICSGTNSKTIYGYEITNPATSDTYTAKIGLMYVSEYRYGADPTQSSSWSNLASSSYSSVRSYNWMHMGYTEWTITRYSDYAFNAFVVDSSGLVDWGNVTYYNRCVRSSFSLKSSVGLAGGSGTVSDPYRII